MDLNTKAEFDCPFQVHADGTATFNLPDVYAPSVYHYLEYGLDILSNGWVAVDGYSGQYLYSGPIMHPSEFLGGRMADDVLNTPGIYVVVSVEDGDDHEAEPDGWVLLRRS